jgi:hypothetical protein
LRVLYYTAGVTGSGHIVQGLSLAAAFRRAAVPVEYSMLSLTSEFDRLAEGFGVPLVTIPPEDEAALGPERCKDSALYRAIMAANPDVLVVDLYWFALDSFIRGLPCKKILLIRQIDPGFFHFRVPGRELVFQPSDWDLVLRTEPHFELPFPSESVEPIVLRDRAEILFREAARADLGIADGEQACLFAFNGKAGEDAEAWKSFSYLEEAGWKVIRSGNRSGGLFPAVDWYGAFDLLVCGAGYNAFWEARYFRKEASFVPFPRRFENQARRIALSSDYEFEENGADQLVRCILGL